MIEQKEKKKREDDSGAGRVLLRSKVNLVDLAGRVITVNRRPTLTRAYRFRKVA